jgi:hypothetical protein
MPQLFMITVPGLEVKSDWRSVHDRLLDEFPAITDVLATTIPETVLIAYEGCADGDAWLEGVDQELTFRQLKPRTERDLRAPNVRSIGVRSWRSQTNFHLALKSNTERNPA